MQIYKEEDARAWKRTSTRNGEDEKTNTINRKENRRRGGMFFHVIREFIQFLSVLLLIDIFVK